MVFQRSLWRTLSTQSSLTRRCNVRRLLWAPDSSRALPSPSFAPVSRLLHDATAGILSPHPSLNDATAEVFSPHSSLNDATARVLASKSSHAPSHRPHHPSTLESSLCSTLQEPWRNLTNARIQNTVTGAHLGTASQPPLAASLLANPGYTSKGEQEVSSLAASLLDSNPGYTLKGEQNVFSLAASLVGRAQPCLAMVPLPSNGQLMGTPLHSTPPSHMQPHSLVRVRGLKTCAEGAESSKEQHQQHLEDPHPLFSKLLIANRGEIACRVIKTARRLGIPTVAIYSDPDRESLHVRLADEAVHIGPAAPNQSYLNMDAVIDAIKLTGASAVHPGYGFLSENTRFVHRLGAEVPGVAFVGPTASAIAAMGDKIESKVLAKAAGVSTIPGVEEVIRDGEHAVSIAKQVGFPVMLKASGGGGGKGMRIARNEKEVKEHFDVCRAEAESSFADPRIFIERYIEQPRHIEIQVMGDKHGNVVWLPERECSIQRRNQKIIEEAPSPFLDASTRQAMGEQAVALSQAVGYESAGTVEFLVDKDKNFFFLEMNTRLQVEHPVTECITGLDLVELMLRVAAGASLPSLTPSLSLTQERSSCIHGWAMEARICCEQPGLNFLPSTGRLRTYSEPTEITEVDEIVRVDTGVTDGDDVSMHYDPLISKVITWGTSRDNAVATMQDALDQYFVEGPSNNIAFIRCVTAHPEFKAGRLSTQFLKDYFPTGTPTGILEDPRGTREAAAVASLLHLLSERAALSAGVPLDALHAPSEKPIKLTVLVEGRPVHVAVEHWPQAHDPSLLFAEVEFEEERILVSQRFPWGSYRGGGSRGVVELDIDGKAAFCQILQRLPRGFKLVYKGSHISEALVMPSEMAPLQRLMPKPIEQDATRLIKSPMPGAIVGIAVQLYQQVVPGEELVTIEAMKMRNVLRAERSGVVKGVFVQLNQLVKPGDNLVEIE